MLIHNWIAVYRGAKSSLKKIFMVHQLTSIQLLVGRKLSVVFPFSASNHLALLPIKNQKTDVLVKGSSHTTTFIFDITFFLRYTCKWWAFYWQAITTLSVFCSGESSRGGSRSPYRQIRSNRSLVRSRDMGMPVKSPTVRCWLIVLASFFVQTLECILRSHTNLKLFTQSWSYK